MTMEFDATQALDLTELVEEQEDDHANVVRGYLRLLAQKELEEYRYPLMDGDNVIGRGESCQIQIRSKVLSKQHACIEIIHKNHFIYDKDSRNKTRRGKLFLKPEARYELNDRDKLVFGDVICIYEKVRPRSSCSDTDEETQALFSMNHPCEDAHNKADNTRTGQEKNGGALVVKETLESDKEESDAESDVSSNLLGSAQSRLPSVGSTPSVASRILADDTPTSGKHQRNELLNESDAFIPESQFVRNNGSKQNESMTDLLHKRATDGDDSDVTDDEKVTTSEDLVPKQTDLPALMQPTQSGQDYAETACSPAPAFHPLRSHNFTPASPDSTQMLSVSPNIVPRNPFVTAADLPKTPCRTRTDDATQLLGLSPIAERRNPYKEVAHTPDSNTDEELVAVSETPPGQKTPEMISSRFFDPVNPTKRTPSRTATASTPPSMSSCHLMPSILSISPVEASIIQHGIRLPPLEESDDVPDLSNSQIVMNSQDSPRSNMPECDSKPSPIIMKQDIMPKLTPKPIANDSSRSCLKKGRVNNDSSVSKCRKVIISEMPATQMDATDAAEKILAGESGYDSRHGNDETQRAEDEVIQSKDIVVFNGIEAGEKMVTGIKAVQECDHGEDIATQKYGGEATQKYGGEATQRYGGEATQKYGGESTQKYGGEATQKYGGEATQAEQHSPEQHSPSLEIATQRYVGETTQAYFGKATQKYDEVDGRDTPPFDAMTQKYGGESIERFGGEATKKLHGENEEDTSPFDVPTQKYRDEETQRFGGEATQKYINDKENIIEADIATQRYGSETRQDYAEESRDTAADECTPPFGIATQKYGGGATQKYNGDEKEDEEASSEFDFATQRYAVDPIQTHGGEATERHGEDAVQDYVEDMQKGGVEATQKYVDYSAKAEKDDTGESENFGGTTGVYGGATQMYLPNDPDDEATQQAEEDHPVEEVEKSEPKKIVDDMEPPQISQSMDSAFAPTSLSDEESSDSADLLTGTSASLISKPTEEERKDVTKDVATKSELVIEESSEGTDGCDDVARAVKVDDAADANTDVNVEAETQMDTNVVEDSEHLRVADTELLPTDTEILPAESRKSPVPEDTNSYEDEPPVLQSECLDFVPVCADEVDREPPSDLTMVVDAKPSRPRRSRKPVCPVLEREQSPPRRGRGRPRKSGKVTVVPMDEEHVVSAAGDIGTDARTTHVHSSGVMDESAKSDKKETEKAKPSLSRTRGRRKTSVVEEEPKPRSTGRLRTSTMGSMPESVHADEEETRDVEETPSKTSRRAARVAPAKRSRKAAVKPVSEDEKEEPTPAKRGRRKLAQPVTEPSRPGRGRRKEPESERDTSVSSVDSRSWSRRRTRNKEPSPEPEPEPEPGPKRRGRKAAKKTPARSEKRGANHDAESDIEVGSKQSRLSVTGSNTMSPRQRTLSLQMLPKVLFTGVVDEKGSKTIEMLGGEIVSSPQSCTHLVTDKVRRTVKFLCCLGRGIPIVSYQWLDKCRQAKKFVDHEPFIVADTEAESHYCFNLRNSIEMAGETQLLAGWRIHVTKSVQPVRPDMAEIIKSAGGTPLATMPKSAAENLLVVSCEEDERTCTLAIQAGLTIVSSECILTGLLRQKVLLDEYCLFAEASAIEAAKRAAAQIASCSAQKAKTTRKKRKR